jgi:hypothetical protein
MKYTSIMNFNALNKSLSKLGPEITLKILDLEAEVSEKIHGENFRLGITIDGKTFIGQRNGTFYRVEEHPNWNRLNEEAQALIHHLLSTLVRKHVADPTNAVTLYGELCGNGMQRGFTYPWTGLKVVYFDVLDGECYRSPVEAQIILSMIGAPYVPVYHNSMTVRDALTLDVNDMKSVISNEDFIEGVVIKVHDLDQLNDLWRVDSRFVIKHKSDKYSEMTNVKNRTPKIVYDSPFVYFVTEARIEHAIQAIEEREPNTIKNEMADMRYIIYEVLDDIAREENDWQPLSKEDKKSVTKAVPKLYQGMLHRQVKEHLGL